MKSILFASTNKGKSSEIKEVFNGSKFKIILLSELKSILPPPSVEEVFNTYIENAKTKATQYSLWSNISCLADDAGLEINALDGAPGVRSARFASENATSEQNIEKVLNLLENKEDRKARFISCLYLFSTDHTHYSASGELYGEIIKKPRGSGGFGYDSIFIPDGSIQTLAEIKESNSKFQTHRTIAARNLLNKLSQ